MYNDVGWAIVMSARPFLRKFYYGFMGIMTTTVGWAVGIGCFVKYRQTHEAIVVPLMILFFLLPFIVVGGEVLRFKKGAKKIRSVRCRKCESEFSLKALYKASGCPKCGSKRVYPNLITEA